MRAPSPHTAESLALSLSLSLSLSDTHTHTHTRTRTHSYPPPCYRLHCTDEILMVLLGRIMNMLVPGVVCMCVCVCVCVRGGSVPTLHTPIEACNKHALCEVHGYKCVFPLFYTHSPEHTPTHTPQSCTDSLTYSPFPFICTPHTETHAHTHTHTDRHTHAMQAYTQHQTLLLTDTHTHTHTQTHTCSHRTGEDGVGGVNTEIQPHP